MIRWKARRRTLAAAVVSVVGGAILALPLTSARAETVQVDMNYRCTEGVAGAGQVNLKVTLTMQTALAVGQPLDVRWKLAYRDNTRFLSPGLFQPGARVTATGVVGVTDELWTGELNSVGSKDQLLLQNGGPLELPELVSGSVSTTQAGVFEVVPRRLLIDFTPPASETVVNDDHPSVQYVGTDWTDFNDREPQNHDIHEDVHASEVVGAEAHFKFTGTGVDFITEQDHRAGQVQFTVDGKPGIPATADASKDRDGNPVVVANQGNYALWGMRGLQYKEHELVVKKTDAKWAMVDGFRVVTEEMADPPKQFRAKCEPVKKPTAIRVNIGGGDDNPVSPSPDSSPDSSPSPDSSASPSGSVSPSASATPTPSGSPSGGQSPSASPSPSASRSPNLAPTQNYVVTVVTVQGTPSPTATKTVTLTATPSVAQVAITPQGGAQTGEAPERVSSSGMLLIGSGGALLMIGMLSGVAMLRRRAAHSGERG
ncbi:hypothetical protein [Microbispora sp. H10830]|uniref:hypothetical protein n=1 Tax=Microbispora sp. H10830 TaxID=2729109 RepID=UPI001602839E|nr:hypothetical protein [Microbispora sp. H10830]